MTQAPDTTTSELPDLKIDQRSGQVRSSPPKRFLISAALVLIIFSAAGYYIFMPNSSPPGEVVPVTEPEIDTSISVIKPNSPELAQITRIPELENRLGMLVRQLKSQSDVVQQNQHALGGLDTTIDQAVYRFTSVLEEKITQLEDAAANQTAALDSRITAIEKSHAARKTKRKKKSIQAPAFPFTLLSVDYWDNKPYAVLGYKGELHHLAPGETLHQWTLDSVTAEQANFHYVNGTKRKLNLEG